MNIAYFKRYGLGGVHSPIPDSLNDAYVAPGTPYVDDVTKNTGESTPEKDKYSNVPGSRITFDMLLAIYPDLKEKMKAVWKKFQRPNK